MGRVKSLTVSYCKHEECVAVVYAKGYCRKHYVSFSRHNKKKLIKNGEYNSNEEGWRDTPEYICWCNMKSRCYNKNNKSYNSYGAKGVNVCKRWHSFKNFIRDMGKRPSDQHSLDRINPFGNYSPDNCRWATPIIQKNNRRIYHKSRTILVYCATLTILNILERIKNIVLTKRIIEIMFFNNKP